MEHNILFEKLKETKKNISETNARELDHKSKVVIKSTLEYLISQAMFGVVFTSYAWSNNDRAVTFSSINDEFECTISLTVRNNDGKVLLELTH